MLLREGVNRRSIRLKEYDYSWPGFYFVTICVKNKECCLSEVIVSDGPFYGPEIKLTEIGKIVREVWLSIPEHHKVVNLDEYIIMPNHLHGIIAIDDIDTVGAIHELPLRDNYNIHELPQQDKLQRRKMLLPKIVGKFKMNSAKEINILLNKTGQSFWQRNYYEHIIRSEKSLDRIRNYIIDNVRRWHEDIENPENNFDINQIKKHYDNLFAVNE